MPSFHWVLCIWALQMLYCFRDTSINSKRHARNPDKEFWFSLLRPGTLLLSLEHSESIRFVRWVLLVEFIFITLCKTGKYYSYFASWVGFLSLITPWSTQKSIYLLFTCGCSSSVHLNFAWTFSTWKPILIRLTSWGSLTSLWPKQNFPHTLAR